MLEGVIDLFFIANFTLVRSTIFFVLYVKNNNCRIAIVIFRLNIRTAKASLVKVRPLVIIIQKQFQQLYEINTIQIDARRSFFQLRIINN